MARSFAPALGLLAAIACTNEMRFLPLGAEVGSAPSSGGQGGAAGALGGDAGETQLFGGSASAGAAGAPLTDGGTSGAGGAASVPVPLGAPGEWELTFQEECDGALNPLWLTYWTWDEPRTQPHTAEYVADDRVSLSDGHCVITADDTPSGDRPYTSGTLHSAERFEQEFGYFEARLKVPRGVGLWADWRLRKRPGWPPAIDVANVFGRDVGSVQLAHYWGEPYPNHSFWIYLHKGTDFSLDFHVYGVEWSATEIVWYVDGIERARTQEGAAFQVGPRFISLSVMVGTGQDPSEPPDATTQWPVELGIDWVRAWRRP